MGKKIQIERKKYLKDELFLAELGKRIFEQRKQKKFTQERLANTIDVDISQISRLERGILNASICLIKEIATALDMELSELFNFQYSGKL